jgi:hypothetical protein
LELERHTLGESENAAAIDEHLEVCACCCALALRIQHDGRRMPALLVPLAAPPRPFWRWRWVLALAPAIALLLFYLSVARVEGPTPNTREGGGSWKGGDTTITLIRERGGALLEPSHFQRQDRFKVEVSCAPGRYSMQLTVTQDGETFTPLAASTQDCSNRTRLPGAFSLDGGPALVCVTIGRSGEPVCQVVEPER